MRFSPQGKMLARVGARPVKDPVLIMVIGKNEIFKPQSMIGNE
jgi:hypothetical protein